MNDGKEPTEVIEDHDARLDAVEGYQSYVKEHVIPRLDELEDALDEKNERINDLEATVASLEHKLETLDGLAEDEQSTPQKRAVDLARAMIRQAEQKPDGRVAKYYKEVKETLATLGHDNVHDPQAYTAMDDVQEATGFGEMTTTREGREVDAVYVNLAELDEEQAVNEIKNEKGAGTAETTSETEPTTT
ncbi:MULTISPECIES: hypothetical protein [Halobacterium]|uniref:hypothetical protein n=1 Tax=Halobacterium TaxID=2239 RepID=UPI00073F0D6F|nr:MULTISPECIES: hypothetical protein [Halobacterium]MCG1002891.1 hypothetical protein [Halobacterium noricense]